jgi:hypothetical protein
LKRSENKKIGKVMMGERKNVPLSKDRPYPTINPPVRLQLWSNPWSDLKIAFFFLFVLWIAFSGGQDAFFEWLSGFGVVNPHFFLQTPGHWSLDQGRVMCFNFFLSKKNQECQF